MAATAQPDRLSVTVGLGPEEAVVVDLARGDFSFGGSLADDLILPGLGPRTWGEVRFGAKGGAVVVPAVQGLSLGGLALVPGAEVAVKLPVALDVGGARVFVPAPPVARAGFLPGLVAVLAAAALVAYATFGASGPTPAPPVPAPVVAAVPAAAPPPLVADLDVGRLARSVDLSTPVTTRREDGEIVVTGSLTETERGRLADAVAAARAARPGAPAVRLETPDPPFSKQVAGVMLSPKRYIVGTDGRRYAPGDTLPGGSRVVRIEDQRIVVSSDGLLDTMELPK